MARKIVICPLEMLFTLLGMLFRHKLSANSYSLVCKIRVVIRTSNEVIFWLRVQYGLVIAHQVPYLERQRTFKILPLHFFPTFNAGYSFAFSTEVGNKHILKWLAFWEQPSHSGQNKKAWSKLACESIPASDQTLNTLISCKSKVYCHKNTDIGGPERCVSQESVCCVSMRNWV